MPHLISIHSFRRGTGKTTLTANLAVLLAQTGRRVAAIDLNLAAPSLHVLFGQDEGHMPPPINDYIWGACDVETCVVEVTRQMGVLGNLFLVGASTQPSHIARMLRGGYVTHLIGDACQELIETLALDFLLVDTQAGVSEETQLVTAMSDVALIVSRLDKQDHQGTGVLVELAKRLHVPYQGLVVNQAPAHYDETAVQTHFANVYPCAVTVVLPHSQNMMTLGSSGVFVLEYPADAATAVLKKLSHWVMAPTNL